MSQDVCRGCGATYTAQERHALELWQHSHPRLTIWCDEHRHRLAKIVLEGERAWVVIPPVKVSPRLIGLRRKDGSKKLAHVHPAALDLAEWIARAQAANSPDDMPLRCKCAAFTLRPGEAANALNYSRGKFGPVPPGLLAEGKYLARRLTTTRRD